MPSQAKAGTFPTLFIQSSANEPDAPFEINSYDVEKGDKLLLISRSPTPPSANSMLVFLLIFFMDTYFKKMFLPFRLFWVHFIFPHFVHLVLLFELL